MRSIPSAILLVAALAWPVAAQAQAPSEVWDLYLACRGAASEFARDSAAAAKDSAAVRVRRFCQLRLPRIGARYSETELRDWTDGTNAMPDSAQRDTMRAVGERWLLQRVDLLGQSSLGNRTLQFDTDSAVLKPEHLEIIRQAAAEFQAELARDPTARLTVTGTADNDGKNEASRISNLNLAHRRAIAIRTGLATYAGIDPTKVVIRADVVPVPVGTSGGIPAARAGFLTSPGASAPLSSTGAAAERTGGGDVSTLLVGTADFLLAEAQRQVEMYLMRQGVTRMCERDEWRRLLSTTCTLVPAVSRDTLDDLRDSIDAARGEIRAARRQLATAREQFAQPGGDTPAARTEIARDSTRLAAAEALETALGARRSEIGQRAAQLRRGYFPGLPQLRETVRQDLRTAPYRIGRRALADRIRGAQQDSTIRQAAAVALYLLAYVEEIDRSGTPLRALQMAGDSVLKATQDASGLASFRAYVEQARSLAGLLTQARADLRPYWTGTTLADSIALYTVKSFFLRADTRSRWPHWFPTAQARAREVERLVETAATMQGLLESVEKAVAEIQSLRGDSVDFRVRRREIVARMVGQTVDLALTALPRSTDGALTAPPVASPIRTLALSLAEGNSAQALNSLLQLSVAVRDDGMLDGDQLRVLTFTTDLVQAQNEAQVQSAFERLVGGGSGYQGKRLAQQWFWRVNAYVGGSVSGEWLTQTRAPDKKPALTLAPMLPVGVEIGWPRPRTESSFGLFVQILDLGAIASARLGHDDEIEDFPTFSFGSVVAPGVFFVHSLGDMPLAALIGAAYFPEGRVDEDGNEWGAIRASIGVAIDIPLFP